MPGSLDTEDGIGYSEYSDGLLYDETGIDDRSETRNPGPRSLSCGYGSTSSSSFIILRRLAIAEDMHQTCTAQVQRAKSILISYDMLCLVVRSSDGLRMGCNARLQTRGKGCKADMDTTPSYWLQEPWCNGFGTPRG